MKKVVFILASLLAFMFIGCGGSDTGSTDSEKETTVQVGDADTENVFSFTPPVEDIDSKTAE